MIKGKYIFIGVVIIALIVWAGFMKSKKVEAPIENVVTPHITYNNASLDLIKVDLPYPGAVTGKAFSVIGSARGTWYFEASFPIDVLDKDGNVLVNTFAMAQGEWMTTDFVPFKSDITIPESYLGPATLVLHKDNPSGMTEKDASISFPFIIEY